MAYPLESAVDLAEQPLKPADMRDRIRLAVRAGPELPPYVQIGIGIAAAAIAVAIRCALPLGPQQLPTLTVVIALAIVTTYIGARAGIACAITGGLASWYLFFNPNSWSLSNSAWIPLIGFAVIATVIVSTSHLYRVSERRLHERELGDLQQQARNARLFAGEMSHRLKNALAIVQSIAIQTMDSATPSTATFVSRLKALADANDLLSEHVSRPEANITDVIEKSLRPFRENPAQFEVASAEMRVPAQQVIALSLALHELGTNAVKYGSLSGSAGRVVIAVTDLGDRLELVWKESGGPPVIPPTRTGFGTRLLRRSGIETQIDYLPDGLRCRISFRKE
jgi:two-component sensor histidine kinase